MGGKAEYLAQWTTLADSRMGDCYVTVRPRRGERSWEVLALEPQGIKLAACNEAEQFGFLETLALAVANWEEMASRPAADIVDMLSHVCSEYGMLQGITDQQKGFMNAQILLPLIKVSQASAIVFTTKPVRKQVGTAFLVKPDLVLTAAHVAMQTATTANGEYWTDALRADLEFQFVARPNDPSSSPVTVRPAATTPVRYAQPHAIPPNKLDLSGAPKAKENLDYALIRLAQRVDHVDPVAIDDSAKVSKGRACWAFGYPPGNALMMDVDKVVLVDDASGRWQHLANTAAGMSGGACVNDEGQVAGIHEGTLEREVDGQTRRFNRGISIAAIRDAQCRNGGDPFKRGSTTEGLEFQDPALALDLYRSVLELAPADRLDQWRSQVTVALGQDPEAGGVLPPFHPWFRRDIFELWIDSRDPARRLCMVFGERGTGCSFTARILKAKLASSGADLLALNATQTRAIGWEDAISTALSAEDSAYRTAAAKARYTDIDTLIGELKRRSADRSRTRYVVLDFGQPDPGFRLEGTPWLELVCALLQNEWVRVVLIGLDEADREALMERVYANPMTDTIELMNAPMTHIDRDQVIKFARSLARARGIERTPNELAAFVDVKLADFSANPSADLQTVAAALLAIMFERGLA